MKSETLIYGNELLVILDENENISFQNLEEISKVKSNELRELLKYLQQKEFIVWKHPLFIGYLRSDGGFEKNDISDDKIKLSPKGMEVVIGQRDYFNEMGISQTIHNQTNVSNSSEFQFAQNTGDKSSIIQTQDNSKINILKQLIENDKELEEPKKKKLFGILEKFNTIKESGENAYELIKQVGLISVKYVPMFLALLS